MVKPGGTGRPRLLISARLAPLPPNRVRRSARPSAAPAPKLYTHRIIAPVPYMVELPCRGRFIPEMGVCRGMLRDATPLAFEFAVKVTINSAISLAIFA